MPDEATDAEPSNVGPAFQLKIRLLEVSPMVWRRLLVPAAAPLRELHGIVQVAMGWEGIHPFRFHLRAARYGSPELSASSPEATLESSGPRAGSRFIHEHDLNAAWRHELRVEQQRAPEAGTLYPLCLDGHGDCPAEDGGRPAGYLARQEAVGFEAMSDLEAMLEVLDAVLRARTTAALDDPDTRSEFEAALERMRGRERFLPVPFSRHEVNARLRRGAHRVLRHQPR